MSVQGDSITAALANGQIWSISLSTKEQHRLDLDMSFTAFATSPDGKITAAANEDDELILIDSERKVIVHRLGYGAIGCMEFQSTNALLVCSSKGIVRIIPRFPHDGPR